MLDNIRVPVIGKDGIPRMPTKASRVKKWIKTGKAVPKWNELGLFCVQLTVDSGCKTQEIVLGLDPGSKFEGIAIVSKKAVLQTAMVILPSGIAKKMERRSNQRRSRRHRNCRRRPARFNYRTKPEGWLAPSQKAKIDFKLKLIDRLRKLYPISSIIVEDIKFNHYRSRFGKHFSTAEIGKTRLYGTLRNWFGDLKLARCEKTPELRDKYNVEKSDDPSERSVNSHAIDALVISASEIGLDNLEIPRFIIWKEYQYPRRQLHRFQFSKGGYRWRYGGSNSLNGLKKGDVVEHRDQTYRVGGYLERTNTISLHEFGIDNVRVITGAKPNECKRLFNQRIMYSPIHPTTKVVGFLGGIS